MSQLSEEKSNTSSTTSDSESYHQKEQREARDARLARQAEHARFVARAELAQLRAAYQIQESISSNELLEMLIACGVFPVDTQRIFHVESTQGSLRISGLRYLSDLDRAEERVILERARPPLQNIVVREEASDDKLRFFVQELLVDNPKVVQDFKAGKEKAIGSLIGPVIKKFKADPVVVKGILVEEIKKL